MSDISIIKEELSKHPNHNVLFAANLEFTDSLQRAVKRTVYASGSDDQFFTGSDTLNIILASTDGSLDIFQRFDALEKAMTEFTESNDPESLLGMIVDVRKQMLPLEIETTHESVIPESAKSVLDMVNIDNYDPATYEIESEDNIRIDVSIDISYEAANRMGIRIFAERVDSVIHDTANELSIIMLKDAVDNYVVMNGINSYELMIDKILETVTSKNKINRTQLKKASKLIKANEIRAF